MRYYITRVYAAIVLLSSVYLVLSITRAGKVSDSLGNRIKAKHEIRPKASGWWYSCGELESFSQHWPLVNNYRIKHINVKSTGAGQQEVRRADV